MMKRGEFRTITDADWREALVGARHRVATAPVRRFLKPGEPCGHNGCAETTDPCQRCGRIAADIQLLSVNQPELEYLK